MSVQEYLDKHMLSRRIEDAVNAAVRSKSPDPVLFISNHLKKSVPAAITKIRARQIFDSRGVPTVEVDLYTNKGMFRAAAPSGAVPGTYEAVELRDGDKGKYLGKGVSKAVKNINERIAEVLLGMDPTLQSQIDQAMIDLDKTENKGELGANAVLAVSIAACKAGAAEKEVPLYKHIADLSGKTGPVLPVPALTVISGGKHAGNNLAAQEIMIHPIGATTFEEAMQMGSETYHHLKAVITEKYGSAGCNVGDDGGLAPNISSFEDALDLVKEAIDRAGYNDKIKLALDVSATDFCIGKKYDLNFKPPHRSGQNFKIGDDDDGDFECGIPPSKKKGFKLDKLDFNFNGPGGFDLDMGFSKEKKSEKNNELHYNLNYNSDERIMSLGGINALALRHDISSHLGQLLFLFHFLTFGYSNGGYFLILCNLYNFGFELSALEL